jgi:hypothetical protein
LRVGALTVEMIHKIGEGVENSSRPSGSSLQDRTSRLTLVVWQVLVLEEHHYLEAAKPLEALADARICPHLRSDRQLPFVLKVGRRPKACS